MTFAVRRFRARQAYRPALKAYVSRAAVATVLLMGAGCSAPSSTSPVVAVNNSPTLEMQPTGAEVRSAFIGVSGTGFRLDGKPTAFVGMNIYNAASKGECWENLADGDTLDNALQKLETPAPGLNAIRVFFFQSFVYRDGHEDWSTFDKIVSLAKKRRRYLFPVIENQWSTCSNGQYKDLNWYKSGYKSDTFSANHEPLTYRDFAVKLVARYKDEPIIDAWTLMNEPEAAGSDGGNCDENSPAQAIHDFTKEITSAVKGADPSHIVRRLRIHGRRSRRGLAQHPCEALTIST